MMPQECRERISKSIREHNFYDFINSYRFFNAHGIQEGIFYQETTSDPVSFCPIIYLPDTASYEDENGKIQYINILSEDTFNMITFEECECG